MLAYVAGVLIALWGVSHAVPTRKVLAGFAPISQDNRRVVEQEWLAEAFTMWGIAALVITVTAVASESNATAWVYRIAATLLFALVGLTVVTGARMFVIWFKICFVLLSTSVVLLLVASV